MANQWAAVVSQTAKHVKTVIHQPQLNTHNLLEALDLRRCRCEAIVDHRNVGDAFLNGSINGEHPMGRVHAVDEVRRRVVDCIFGIDFILSPISDPILDPSAGEREFDRLGVRLVTAIAADR
jgi:hypothetical protein